MTITREQAERVRDVVDAGLVDGLGHPTPGQMCVEAAVCYALGEKHSDSPTCVSPALREFKICLNDARWSSPQARAKGLRRLAIAQLGSRGALDERAFAKRVAEMTIRLVVPIALRVAAAVSPTHAEQLESAAIRCEQDGSAAAAADATAAAEAVDSAAYAARAAGAAAADTRAVASAAHAAYAASAAAAAAVHAASAARAAAVASAAAAAADAPDRVLADVAEWVVEILIDMQAPGCAFLDLVPAESRP